MSTDTHLPAPSAATTLASDSIGDELRRYDAHLRDVRGLSPGTGRDY